MEERPQTPTLGEEGWACCCPRGWLGSLFWGVTLMVFGVMLLLSEIGLVSEDWWGFLIAAALIGWGLTILANARERSGRKGLSARG